MVTEKLVLPEQYLTSTIATNSSKEDHSRQGDALTPVEGTVLEELELDSAEFLGAGGPSRDDLSGTENLPSL